MNNAVWFSSGQYVPLESDELRRQLARCNEIQQIAECTLERAKSLSSLVAGILQQSSEACRRAADARETPRANVRPPSNDSDLHRLFDRHEGLYLKMIEVQMNSDLASIRAAVVIAESEKACVRASTLLNSLEKKLE